MSRIIIGIDPGVNWAHVAIDEPSGEILAQGLEKFPKALGLMRFREITLHAAAVADIPRFRCSEHVHIGIEVMATVKPFKRGGTGRAGGTRTTLAILHQIIGASLSGLLSAEDAWPAGRGGPVTVVNIEADRCSKRHKYILAKAAGLDFTGIADTLREHYADAWYIADLLRRKLHLLKDR